MSKTVCIWDSSVDVDEDEDDTDIALWLKYSVTKTSEVISIPSLVESNADYFREKYISLIYEMGLKENIDGVNIINLLKIRSDFSYWWMTLFVEKDNFYKSPQISNIIKLMAFSEWLDLSVYDSIHLVSENKDLARSIKLIADKKSVRFFCSQQVKENNIYFNIHSFRFIYSLFPFFFKGVVWMLYYIITRLPLRGVGIENWSNTFGKKTFISYMVNVRNRSFKYNYMSDYWNKLPKMMLQEGVATNWLHLYVGGKSISDAFKTKKAIKHLNSVSDNMQTHVVLDSFLTLSIIARSLRDFFNITKRFYLITILMREQVGVYFPLILGDLKESMLGKTALNNLLYFNLIEKAANSLPHQSMGVYLQENKGWEFSFVNRWRVSGHENNLIGVPHSTVRYWDLRYFNDVRNYFNVYKLSMPIPDKVAINGNDARKKYIKGGYPESSLIDVEALRFLYLEEKINNNTDKGSIKKTLLVLGDCDEEYTKQQMNLLNKAVDSVYNKNAIYTVKSHPLYAIAPEDYPNLNIVMTNDSIANLLTRFTMVYTSSITSAAVDAYCQGKIVITALDHRGINSSPLKNYSGVFFISSADELSDILNKIGNSNQVEYKGQGKDYFYLNNDLPRWRKILIDDSQVEKK